MHVYVFMITFSCFDAGCTSTWGEKLIKGGVVLSIALFPCFHMYHGCSGLLPFIF